MQLTGSQDTDPPTPRKPSCGHALDNDPADAIPWAPRLRGRRGLGLAAATYVNEPEP